MRRIAGGVLFLTGAAACVIVALRAEDPPPPAGFDLTIFYSNNLHGELEPCGCTEGQLGGLARRARFVEDERSRGPVLLLDSGDTLFRREPIPDILKPQLSLKAKTIARLYEKMGCDALCLGELDFAQGKELVDDLSANAPLWQPRGVHYEERSIGPARVGVLVVVPPSVQELCGQSPTEPVEAARSAIAVDRKPVDFLVCLSHLGVDGEKALAAAIPDLDFIVGGHDAKSLESPERIGRTIIVQAGERGKFLGRLRLHLLPGWRSAELLEASENERWRELALEYDGVVERFKCERDAATAPGDRERAQQRVEQYTKEAADARARVRDLAERSWFANRLVPLDQRVQDDPEVAEAVRLYKEEARKLNESLAEQSAHAQGEGPAYLGGQSCIECHRIEHDDWATSPHAHAFDSLVRRGQDMDLECIGCHATAFQEKGGFFLPSKVGDWKGVQCESCHGPGEGHPPRRLVVGPPRDICIRCHQPPQQEGFDYDVSLPKTRHAK